VKSRHAAQSAELGGVNGSGYLAVLEEGFRRCEGMFRCRLADRTEIIAMLEAFPSFRGMVYHRGTDIGRRSVEVAIRAFRSEPGGIVVELRAIGEWWHALDGPPQRSGV
jgi:hypothetical protein